MNYERMYNELKKDILGNKEYIMSGKEKYKDNQEMKIYFDGREEENKELIQKIENIEKWEKNLTDS